MVQSASSAINVDEGNISKRKRLLRRVWANKDKELSPFLTDRDYTASKRVKYDTKITLFTHLNEQKNVLNYFNLFRHQSIVG